MQDLEDQPPEIADAALIRSVIQRVATGPELSKDISRVEAASVMRAILEDQIDPVQAAVILIGLRMKRETDEEVRGILDALLAHTSTVTCQSDQVISIADPYNGFNRTIQSSLFVLPVLAACGCPAYSHGVELVGPKYGVTHHTTLRALGANPLLDLQSVKALIDDPQIGWGYIDQKVFCEALFRLNTLRRLIVKRPVLTTAEVLLTAIQGKEKTHLLTGYVHKPYRDTYIMLAKHAGLDSMLLVKGTEGGIIPSFRAHAHIVRYLKHNKGNENASIEQAEVDEELDIDLAPLNLEREYRAENIPQGFPAAELHPDYPGMKWDIAAVSTLCAERGRDALGGSPGATRDAVILGAAMTLWHLGKEPDMAAAVAHCTDVVDSGEALHRLMNGLAAMQD